MKVIVDLNYQDTSEKFSSVKSNEYEKDWWHKYGAVSKEDLKNTWVDSDWWTGCKYVSRGCYNCCGNALTEPFKFHGFYLPEKPCKLFVVASSDFFLEEADPYREKAWEYMVKNPKYFFYIVTKRPKRLMINNPLKEWPKNIFFHVTIDEQITATDKLDFCENSFLPYYGSFFEPLTERLSIDLSKYKKLKWVHSGGEFFDKNFCKPTNIKRPCRYEWLKEIYDECEKNNIWFEMGQTGTFWYDRFGKYHVIENFLDQEKIGKTLPFSKRKNWTDLKDIMKI